MNKEEWDLLGDKVARLMLEYTKPFVTPISKVIEMNVGEHLGSGSFIADGESNYLITNAHVASELKSAALAHKFGGCEEYVYVKNPFCAFEYPIDVAIAKIQNETWNTCRHNAQPIPIDLFSYEHQPTDGELVFFVGFSGERSGFCFNTLHAPGTPYLTQISDFPEKYGDINCHFAIHYNQGQARSVDGKSWLPNPHGMSGSLIWNTRFIEFMNNNEIWSPVNSCITGIVREWVPSYSCLLATKVEFMGVDDLLKKMSLLPDETLLD